VEFNGVSLVLGDYEPIPQTTTSRWQTVLSSNGAFDIPSPTPKGNPLCPTRSKRLWRGTLFCLRKIDRLHKRFLFAGLADANAGRKDPRLSHAAESENAVCRAPRRSLCVGYVPTEERA